MRLLTFLIVVFCVLTHSACEEEETLPTCEISNIVVEPYCNDSGEILIDFEFDYNGDHAVFEVAGSGYQFDPFNYSELFYTVGPFPNVNDMMCELVIEFDDCSGEAFGWCDTFEGCVTTTCEVSNIVVEPYCNDNDEILIDFEFDYNGNHTVFEVAGSGYQFGPFNYGELFYTVGPFPNVNDMMCELVIEFDDCSGVEFGWCDTFEGCN